MTEKTISFLTRALLIAICAVAVIVAMTIVFQSNSTPWLTNMWAQWTSSDTSSTTNTKNGIIYFSARINKPGYLPTLFALNIDEYKVSTFGQGVQDIITNAEQLSPDQHMAVYSAAPLLVEGGNYYLPHTTQLNILDATTGEVHTLTNSGTYKTTPEWSPSGNFIAFAARSLAGTSTDVHPDSWSVMVTDLSGKERFVTKGMYPQWQPNGIYLLVLKNDGVYLVNKDTLDESNVPGLDEVGSFSNATIDLARDGTKLAISLPDESKTYIFDMPRLGNSALNVRQVISGQTSWPTFSEDSQQVALYERREDANGIVHAEIVMYDLETGQKNGVYDLSIYDPQSIAITDWRNY